MATVVKKRCRTLGDAGAYTHEHKWKGTRSERTNLINLNHGYSFCGKSVPLSQLAEPWWWDQFVAFHKKENPQWSVATMNRVRSAVTTCVNFTRERGLHSVKVPECVKRVRELRNRHVFYTREQVKKMSRIAAEYFNDPALSRAILVAPSTGMRQTELLKLRAEDIDFDANCIWIGGKPNRVTKNSEYRAVPISPSIQIPLHELVKEANSPRTRIFGQYWDNGDQLRRQFKKVLDAMEIDDPQYCWHTFRHTFATWLGETETPRTIMDLGGWKDMTMVTRYTHATDEAKHKALAGLWGSD